MSTGETNGHSNTDHRQSDLAVMDAQEYKQKRRLRRILDAHDHVEEVVNQSYGQFAEGIISMDGKNIRILQAVQEYIRECYNLLMEHSRELEDGQNVYWVGSEADGPLGRIKMDHDRDIIFWGLHDVLHAEPLYTEEWTEYTDHRHGTSEFEEYSQTHSVPERVSIDAFLVLNEFLSEERDLVGVRFDDGGVGTWGFKENEEPKEGQKVI